jgi:hypothetical protein
MDEIQGRPVAKPAVDIHDLVVPGGPSGEVAARVAFRQQVLFYPVTAASFDTGSYQKYATGYFLRRDTRRTDTGNAPRLSDARQAGTRHQHGPSVAVRGKPTVSPTALTARTPSAICP